MIKKPEINKTGILTTIIIFAVLTVKLMYEFSRLGRLLPKYIILNLFGAVALTALFAVCLVPVLSKDKLNGQTVFGLATLVYLFAFNTDEYIIRIDVISFFVSISVMFLLARKIWGLIIISVAGAIMSYYLWHAAADCLPAVMCISMISFAPMFRKAKPISKKKAKKLASAEPVPDNKKEKIIFIVCETVIAGALLATTIIHKHFVNAFQFQCNFRYYIFPAILAAVLVGVAIVAIVQKRSIVEIGAYLVPAFSLPIAAVSEYTMAVNYGTALLLTCFIISGEDCLFAELVQKATDALMSKVSPAAKEE